MGCTYPELAGARKLRFAKKGVEMISKTLDHSAFLAKKVPVAGDRTIKKFVILIIISEKTEQFRYGLFSDIFRYLLPFWLNISDTPSTHTHTHTEINICTFIFISIDNILLINT